ncbi:AAA domain protein [Roseovarius mucosus DSM 17069]|uniref:AAA domain protein n=1 Tax=Roseovarius mucosus DSM 17069 TaxID=1288298 RepID=A0A0A0HRZ9_9RHOB|nr:AAA family ATPase [Roseovarius mucosus]KGM88838.1 AAA domain protein [Roseovarius mucosus DSM 17069]
MSRFEIKEIVEAEEEFNGRLFPLPRAEKLQLEYAKLFSAHLGRLRSGKYFEGEVLVVTGKSGSGKTSEIVNMMANFNAAEVALPGGQNARMVSKELDRKGGWKDLGKKTLRAMGYPIEDKVRMTQSAIWERVAFQGRHQGIVSINYDEVQHILSGKEGLALEAELDSFKSILKSKTWPFLLVLSGIPELDDKIQNFEQLGRKVTHVTFTDIEYDDDASTVHEMMGSYALEARLEVSDDLNSEDFIHRLATAGAFRWGLVCKLVRLAVCEAKVQQSTELTREHFIDTWVSKTEMNPLATPYNHDSYDTYFRRERPFAQMFDL